MNASRFCLPMSVVIADAHVTVNGCIPNFSFSITETYELSLPPLPGTTTSQEPSLLLCLSHNSSNSFSRLSQSMDVLLNSAYKQGAHTPSSLNIVLGLWFDKTHFLQKTTFFFGSIIRNPLKIDGMLLLDFFAILFT